MKCIKKLLNFCFFYLPYLLKEMLVSATKVSKIILSTDRTKPGMMELKKLATNNASVIYANSITLTPGTYTIEIDSENILVHSLDKLEKENIIMRKKIEALSC